MSPLLQRRRSEVNSHNIQSRKFSSIKISNDVGRCDINQKQKLNLINYSQRTLSNQQFLYLILSSTFITCFIAADVIGGKLFELKLPFSVFGYQAIDHTCGMITFPVTFVIGDLITEYFGPSATKRTVYLGLVVSLFAFIVFNIAQLVPPSKSILGVSQHSFDMIFGSAKLLYVGSLCAYLIGQLSNIWIFEFIKKVTGGKYLWLRSSGSTIISQLLDSVVVSYLGFSLGKSMTGQTPATIREVMGISATGYGLKFIITFALTPLLYLLRFVMISLFKLQTVPTPTITVQSSFPESEQDF